MAQGRIPRSGGVDLMRDTEQKVQEARDALESEIYDEMSGGDPRRVVRWPDMLDALIAAVREDERERLKQATWWFDGGVCHLSSCLANGVDETETEAECCDCGLAKFEAVPNA
jgi:hypothetical protein